MHSYGADSDDELDEDEALAAVLPKVQGQSTEPEASTENRASLPNQAPTEASSSQKKCVCGGTNHARRSSLLCPLNKRHSKNNTNG